MIAIAIDGPAGAGKSTIAKRAAKELDFIYVDTGALYRAIALYMMRHGISANDSAAVVAALPKISVDIVHEKGEQRVILNGEGVSDYIRSSEVSRGASDVSAIPEVREFLLQLQRDLAEKNNVIMDGRDIGTVVLPEAKIKIYLFASPEDRAHRRFQEMLEKGVDAEFSSVLEEIQQRDYNDMNREIAPLRPAEDAVAVDTTGNTLEESVELITNLIKECLG